MKKGFVLAGAIGYLVPVIFGFSSMALLATPRPGFTRVFNVVFHFTCPFWRLSPSQMLMGNTVLYLALFGIIALIWDVARSR